VKTPFTALLLSLPLSLYPAELVTSGLQGRIFACSSCPAEEASGGLVHLSTLVSEYREREPGSLWFDLGGGFMGGDFKPDRVETVIDLFETLNISAINVSGQDFRYGFPFFYSAVEDSSLSLISANLVNPSTQELVFPAKLTLPNQRGVVIGLTQPPLGMEFLPQLKEKYDGVQVVDPAQALSRELKSLSGKQAVWVLYDGDLQSQRDLLKVMDQFPDLRIRLLVQKQTHQRVSKDPRLLRISSQGRSLSILKEGAVAEEKAIDRSSPADPALLEQLKAAEFPMPGAKDSGTLAPSKPSSLTWTPGELQPLRASAVNRGIGLSVLGIRLSDQVASIQAAPGKQFAIVDLSFENRQGIDLLLEHDYEEALMVGELQHQLFLVRDQLQVSSIAPAQEQLSLALPKRFTLSKSGTRRRGQVVFEVSAESPRDLSLVYVPELFPALELPLQGEPLRNTEPKMIQQADSDEAVRLGLTAFQLESSFQGKPAPEGMQWAILELAGRSLTPLTLDAIAIKEDAEAGARIETQKVFSYEQAQRMLQLVVDGGHAYLADTTLSSLKESPAFLPGWFSGGRLVFAIPKEYQRLELYAGFPDISDGKRVRRPSPLFFHLDGDKNFQPNTKSQLRIPDAPLPLDILKVSLGKEGQELILELQLSNSSDQGGLYSGSTRATLQLGDREVKASRMSLKGDIPLREPFWVPANEQPRRFRMHFPIRKEDERARFAYSGVSRVGSLDIDLLRLREGDEDALSAGESTETQGEAFGEKPGQGITAPQVTRNKQVLPSITWNPKEESFPYPEGNLKLPKLELGDARLEFLSMGAYQQIGARKAPEGSQLLLLVYRVEKTDQESSSPLPFAQRFHLVANAKSVADWSNPPSQLPHHSNSWSPAWIAEGEDRGCMLFMLPAEELQQLELLAHNPEQGNQVLTLRKAEQPLSEAVQSQTHAFSEVELHGVNWFEDLATKKDAKSRWLFLDLRAKSLLPSAQGHARPFLWSEWRNRIQLVVNGRTAIPLNPQVSSLPKDLRILPELRSGGQLAFEVPEVYLEGNPFIEVIFHIPSQHQEGKGPLLGKTLRMPLMGKARHPQEMATQSLSSTQDLDVEMKLLKVERAERIGGTRAYPKKLWVALDLQVQALPEEGVYVDPARRVQLLLGGGTKQVNIHARSRSSAQRLLPSRGSLWIPQGDIRDFRLYLEVPQEDQALRLRWNGILDYKVEALPGEGGSKAMSLTEFQNEAGKVVVFPNREAGGIASVGLKPNQVNAAIDRGREYLWQEVQKASKSYGYLDPRREHLPALYALVHTGAQQAYPEFDDFLERSLAKAEPSRFSTYENSLLIMIAQKSGNPSLRPLLEACTQFLVETQGRDGSWSYTSPHPSLSSSAEEATELRPGEIEVLGGEAPRQLNAETGLSRTQGWELGKDGDNSCTQFAVLGLWAAERAGLKIDPEVWKRVATLTARRQNLRAQAERFGGYSYVKPASSYGSMSGAALCTAAIAARRVDDSRMPLDYLRNRNSLGWFADHFQVELNPFKEHYNYYYLYSIERVGQILGTEFLGEHEWYPLGAKYLVTAQQASGSWPTGKSENNSILTTSYALLFLIRATPELDPEPQAPGPGTLSTEFLRPDTGKQLYVILDASGSMRGQAGASTKFDQVKQALAELITVLPADSKVALRVYGHTKRAIQEGADTDSSLLIPLGERDAATFNQVLNRIRPMGKTPLTYSLEQTWKDLSRAKEDTLVLLLTDGGEDSRKNPIAAAAQFADQRHQLHIIGFDINRPAWTEQLTAMAKAAGGNYVPVQNTQRLAQDVKSMVYPEAPSFRLSGPEGQEFAAQEFGQASLELPPGAYVLQSSYLGKEIKQAFHIASDRRTTIRIKASDLFSAEELSQLQTRPQALATPGSVQPPSAPTQPQAAKFCTQCGTRLPEGARFCPGCGKKL